MQNNQMANALKQQMIQNPKGFAQNALKSGYFKGQPMLQGALEAVASDNMDKMNEIVENQCREHNVSMQEAVAQYRQYYGLG